MRILPIVCVIVAGVAAGGVVVGLGGCADQQKTTVGEVPPGYDSWEDYSRAQDKMQMEIERAFRRNPPSSGVPR